MRKFVHLNPYGNLIVSRDIYKGPEVVFPSISEFNRVTNKTLPDLEYWLYEPPNFHVVGIDGENDPSQDNTLAEQLLSNIEVYQTRLEDPLYGLGGQDLIDMQNKIDKINAYKARVNALENAAKADGIRKITLEQAEEYIDGQYDPTDLNAALSDLNSATDNAGVKQAVGDALLALRELMVKSRDVDLRIAKALLAAVAEPEE